MVAAHTSCFRRRLRGRVRALPLLSLPLLRDVFVRKVRGRTAVLDRAGDLDRRLQGLRQAHELLRRLRVLKLRVSVDKRRRVNLVSRRMNTRPGRGGGRRDMGVKAQRAYGGSEALAVQELGYQISKHPLSHSLHLLAFINVHHLEQLHHLLDARANANSTSHHACMPRTGLMCNTRADIDEWDIQPRPLMS